MVLQVGNPFFFLTKHYFQGDRTKELNPKDFYRIAEKWYLRVFVRQPESILNHLKNHLKWPVEK